MIFYLYFFLFLVLFSYGKTAVFQDKKENFWTLDYVRIFFFALVISVFLGIRDLSIGCDSGTYVKIFQDPKSYNAEIEKGFAFINKLLGYLSKNGNFYLFSISFFIAFMQVLCYYKISNENYLMYSILYLSFFYFYQFHLNIMREGLAITFVTFAFILYRKRKFKLYFLFTLIACTLHITALIGFLYPVFYKINKTKFTSVFYMIITIVLLFTPLVSRFIAFIPEVHWSISKIKWYFVIADPVRIKQTHLISFSIIFLFILNYSKMEKSSCFDLYKFYIVFFAFISIFGECVLVYDRFYFYLQVLEPILIYEVRVLFKEKSVFNVLILFFSFLMSLFTIFIWGSRNFITPYKIGIL